MLYTIERIERIEDIDTELAHFFLSSADEIAEMYGGKFSSKKFDYLHYARNGIFWVCRRNGVPLGIMLARLYESIFDPNVKILSQDLLWVKGGTFRIAHLLLAEFIDFGRANANHILTQTHSETNIKPRSLERMGFERVEDVYRMECE